MIKKLSVLVLAVALMLTCMTPFVAQAAAEPIKENVDVLADIEVKASADAAYVDGPLSVDVTNMGTLPTFDFKATLDMKSVRDAFNQFFSKEYFEGILGVSIDDSKVSDIKAGTTIKGEMTTTVNIPNGLELPAGFAEADSMTGYGPSANIVAHKEVSRTLSDVSGGKQLVITTKVVDPLDPTQDEVAGNTIAADIDTYLGDLYLECTGLTPAAVGSYEISGSVTGYTDIYYLGTKVATISFNAKQDSSRGETKLAESVNLYMLPVAPGGTVTGSGGGSGGIRPSVTLEFSVNGDKTIIDPIKSSNKVTVDLDKIKIPAVNGYIAMDKWYTDAAMTKPVTGEYTTYTSAVLYTSYVSMSVPSSFTEEHHGYIQGYPDGEVKPEQSITREEVAALLYRLLKDSVREELKSTEVVFSDVASERWSSTEIATMVKGGYIKGYEDGTFRPSKAITRAEFATLIARFIDTDTIPAIKTTYSDISGHWAEEYIEKAAGCMLIAGYTDKTFRPDNEITRAEAVTILNRILVRHVDKEGLHEDAKHWPDNNESDWYFYHILEATNSHDHNRRENSHLEDWTAKNENRDWTQD